MIREQSVHGERIFLQRIVRGAMVCHGQDTMGVAILLAMAGIPTSTRAIPGNGPHCGQNRRLPKS